MIEESEERNEAQFQTYGITTDESANEEDEPKLRLGGTIRASSRPARASTESLGVTLTQLRAFKFSNDEVGDWQMPRESIWAKAGDPKNED